VNSHTRIVCAALLIAVNQAAPAWSADCRSETAAKAGAQQGYERDKNAAIETEWRESASSDVIGRCIGGITSIIVVPTFPSLQQIFAQAAQKMCNVARDKIREAATIPSGGIPGLPTTSIPIPVTSAPQTTTEADSKDHYWSRMWR